MKGEADRVAGARKPEKGKQAAKKLPARKAVAKKGARVVAPARKEESGKRKVEKKPVGKKAVSKKTGKRKARAVTSAPTVEEANPPGRPTLYEEAFAAQAGKLCRLGATDKELAEFFEVNPDTIYEWKKTHAEFSESLKKGKMTADAEVADRLFKRATGYRCKAVKFATFEGKITDKEDYVHHHPPDTVACIFWLKNRRPDLWRDKVEVKGELAVTQGSGFSPEEDEAVAEFVANIRSGLKPPGT